MEPFAPKIEMVPVAVLRPRAGVHPSRASRLVDPPACRRCDRYRGLSGLLLLTLSFVDPDPKETWGAERTPLVASR
jgi:hypothetical protein